MRILTREEYYLLYAYFHIASEAQKQVRQHTKLIVEILKEGRETDEITDSIYSNTDSSKKEFDELLSKLGLSIQWKKPENKIFKEESEKEQSS